MADATGFEPELSRTVGWFTTLFPVTVDPGTAADFTAPAYLAAALKAVKEDLAAVPGNGVSYGALRYLSETGLTAPAPQVLFNYLGRFDAGASGDWQLVGITGQLGEKRDPRMRLPRALEFNAIAEPDASGAYELVTTISWPEGMFTDEDITTLGAYFRAALSALAALEEGGHTPSDFALVRLTQADVDDLDGPALRDILPLTPSGGPVLPLGLRRRRDRQLRRAATADAGRRRGRGPARGGGHPAAQAVPQPGRPVHRPRRRPGRLRRRERRTGALRHAGPPRPHRRGDPRPRRAGPPRRLRPGRRAVDAVHAHPRRLRPQRPGADRAPHRRRRLVGTADAPRAARRVPRAGERVPARRLPRLRDLARRTRPGRERAGVARRARRSARPLAGGRGAHPPTGSPTPPSSPPSTSTPPPARPVCR